MKYIKYAIRLLIYIVTIPIRIPFGVIGICLISIILPFFWAFGDEFYIEMCKNGYKGSFQIIKGWDLTKRE